MDISRRRFREQLNSIHKALCLYIEEKAEDDLVMYINDVKLRYAIILAAVDDLHYGTQEEQEDAIRYFKSDVYKQHSDECFLSKKILDKIINNPTQYANSIEYANDELEDEWLGDIL